MLDTDPDALCYLLDAARDLCLACASGDWMGATVGAINVACWLKQSRIL